MKGVKTPERSLSSSSTDSSESNTSTQSSTFRSRLQCFVLKELKTREEKLTSDILENEIEQLRDRIKIKKKDGGALDKGRENKKGVRYGKRTLECEKEVVAALELIKQAMKKDDASSSSEEGGIETIESFNEIYRRINSRLGSDIGKKNKCQTISRSRSTSPSPPRARPSSPSPSRARPSSPSPPRARPNHPHSKSKVRSRSISSSPSPAKPRTKSQLPDRTRFSSTSHSKVRRERYRSRRPSISPSRFRGKLFSPSPMNRSPKSSSSESENCENKGNESGMKYGKKILGERSGKSSHNLRSASSTSNSNSSGTSSDSDSNSTDSDSESKSVSQESSQVIKDTSNTNKRYSNTSLASLVSSILQKGGIIKKEDRKNKKSETADKRKIKNMTKNTESATTKCKKDDNMYVKEKIKACFKKSSKTLASNQKTHFADNDKHIDTTSSVHHNKAIDNNNEQKPPVTVQCNETIIHDSPIKTGARVYQEKSRSEIKKKIKEVRKEIESINVAVDHIKAKNNNNQKNAKVCEQSNELKPKETEADDSKKKTKAVNVNKQKNKDAFANIDRELGQKRKAAVKEVESKTVSLGHDKAKGDENQNTTTLTKGVHEDLDMAEDYKNQSTTTVTNNSNEDNPMKTVNYHKKIKEASVNQQMDREVSTKVVPLDLKMTKSDESQKKTTVTNHSNEVNPKETKACDKQKKIKAVSVDKQNVKEEVIKASPTDLNKAKAGINQIKTTVKDQSKAVNPNGTGADGNQKKTNGVSVNKQMSKEVGTKAVTVNLNKAKVDKDNHKKTTVAEKSNEINPKEDNQKKTKAVNIDKQNSNEVGTKAVPINLNMAKANTNMKKTTVIEQIKEVSPKNEVNNQKKTKAFSANKQMDKEVRTKAVPIDLNKAKSDTNRKMTTVTEHSNEINFKETGDGNKKAKADSVDKQRKTTVYKQSDDSKTQVNTKNLGVGEYQKKTKASENPEVKEVVADLEDAKSNESFQNNKDMVKDKNRTTLNNHQLNDTTAPVEHDKAKAANRQNKISVADNNVESRADDNTKEKGSGDNQKKVKASHNDKESFSNNDNNKKMKAAGSDMNTSDSRSARSCSNSRYNSTDSSIYDSSSGSSTNSGSDSGSNSNSDSDSDSDVSIESTSASSGLTFPVEYITLPASYETNISDKQPEQMYNITRTDSNTKATDNTKEDNNTKEDKAEDKNNEVADNELKASDFFNHKDVKDAFNNLKANTFERKVMKDNQKYKEKYDDDYYKQGSSFENHYQPRPVDHHNKSRPEEFNYQSRSSEHHNQSRSEADHIHRPNDYNNQARSVKYHRNDHKQRQAVENRFEHGNAARERDVVRNRFANTAVRSNGNCRKFNNDHKHRNTNSDRERESFDNRKSGKSVPQDCRGRNEARHRQERNDSQIIRDSRNTRNKVRSSKNIEHRLGPKPRRSVHNRLGTRGEEPRGRRQRRSPTRISNRRSRAPMRRRSRTRALKSRPATVRSSNNNVQRDSHDIRDRRNARRFNTGRYGQPSSSYKSDGYGAQPPRYGEQEQRRKRSRSRSPYNSSSKRQRR